MAGSIPTGKTWNEAMDLEAAGRVLGALDDPEADLLNGGDESDFSAPTIEGYLIDRRLGGGGGGEVFRAVRTGSDRPLAIKILNQRIGETPEARRAWRELDVLGQLRLPCIPRLLDHGIHDGRMFLVTEYIDGHPLVEHCEVNELDREARVELLAKIADAVQALHEHGVIHRDIKPSNILVGKDGEPVLIDLGIAALLSRSAAETLTKDGAPIGSPAFMAPEQARGDKEAVSTRSDVYSLGATAYVLLTGGTPHDMSATLHEAIRRVAMDEPRQPRELEPMLPKPLAAVLGRAAARNAEQRYVSPAEFARDLRRWLNREAVEAGGLSLAQRFGRALARHPIAVTAAACAAFIIATVIASYGAVWWLNQRPFGVQIDPVDRSWVRLVSFSGRVLEEWNTNVANGVRFAAMVEAADSGGRGQIVLLGLRDAREPALSDQLCAFDPKDLGTPLWVSGKGPPEIDMPPPISTVEGTAFSIASAALMDIFPEPDSPGLEIIAIHAHEPHSAYLVRVYDLDGVVLYQVWHDGLVRSPYWMSGPGLLVLCGLNSEATWAERGRAVTPPASRPMVVFAVKPELDQINREWIHTPGGGGKYEPAWYRCVLPPHLYEFISHDSGSFLLETPQRRHAPERHVRVGMHGDVFPHVALNICLNEHGEEIARFVGDPWVQMEGYPMKDDYQLGELPPIIDPARHR